MKLVSIIIVNYNRKEYLRSCLNSAKSQTYPNIETIVIDDCSSDGSVEMVNKEFPQMAIISNEEEKQFCVSKNIGISKTRGEYIFFLETDVVLEEEYIDKLVQSFSLNEQIGMAVGKILRADGLTIDSTGLFLGRSRKPIDRGFNQKDTRQFDMPGYVFGVGHIAGLFRRFIFEDVKLNGEYLDDTYGLFYEDLDLSWIAKRRGWKAYYNPKAIAYHARGGTTKSELPKIKLLKRFYFSQLSEELQFHLVKNRYMTIIKNDTIKQFLLNFFFILLYDLKLWSYILLFRPKIILKLPSLFKYGKIAFHKRRNINNRMINQLVS